MQIRTRVFDIAKEHGYENARQLATAMDVSEALVSRVKNEERGVNRTFIAGALRAFPGKTFDDLFVIEPDEPASVA